MPQTTLLCLLNLSVTRKFAITLKVDILYTNIGRGHPYYLDGLVEALVRTEDLRLIREQRTVFDVSDDIARVAWKTARWLYRHGSSGGIVGAVYARLRSQSDYNRPSLALRIMGRDILRTYRHRVEPLVVAHPTLVGMLQGKENLIYQHGELVAPQESLVNGAGKVLVPTRQVAGLFQEAGYGSEDIVVTGLCIEPPLVAQAEVARSSRLARFDSAGPLTVALYSSGAEPVPHVDVLVSAMVSIVRAGHRAIAVVQRGGAYERAIGVALMKNGHSVAKIEDVSSVPSDLPRVAVVPVSSRQEEYQLTARLFPWFDLFVAPPHERSNWAVGLGLPMLAIEPAIGPFAPLNRELLRDRGVARALSAAEAADAGKIIDELRSTGELARMSENGWGREPIDGFGSAARYIIEKYSTPA